MHETLYFIHCISHFMKWASQFVTISQYAQVNAAKIAYFIQWANQLAITKWVEFFPIHEKQAI